MKTLRTQQLMNTVLESTRFTRLHVNPDPLSISEAAAFIVSALLLSHGVRRDALAILNVGGRFIYAPGSKIRHLRPDLDTAEGWIRAVLRGKPLGAFVTDSLEIPANKPYSLCVRCCPGSLKSPKATSQEASMSLSGAVLTIYTSKPCSRSPELLSECPLSLDAELPAPLHIMPAIVNIELDRITAGLRPLLLGLSMPGMRGLGALGV